MMAITAAKTGVGASPGGPERPRADAAFVDQDVNVPEGLHRLLTTRVQSSW
jgi:hypothetical protein